MKSQPRKLAAILFADIVGYTALMQRNEEEGIRKVERFRAIIEEKVSQHTGEIFQYYGDGCLILFSSGISALQCAKDIQEELNNNSGSTKNEVVPVRIGIHIGDVVVKGKAIYGDGVNLASRIESLGIPGSVLFSERLIADIKSHPQIKYVSLGEFHFKNVDTPIEVFALTNKGFPIPKRSEITGKLQDKTLKKGFAKWIKQLPARVSNMLGDRNQDEEEQVSSDASIDMDQASIAVLPFKDMSPEKDQAYFADGIAEEILTTLSKLTSLKVAGRTSSFSFKDKEVTILEIGKVLNVNHILEGSVRKHGNKIRITAQLIKVSDGFHLWSNKYDNDFTDIFKIQDAVAENIGKALLEKLAPEQLDQLKGEEIQNTEAYELFLRAKHIFTNRYRPTLAHKDFLKSEELFLAAIELDSSYALAHAGLASLYDTHVLYVIGDKDNPTYEKYNQLRIKESELAFNLDPLSAYVNEVRGNVLLNTQANLEDVYTSYLKAYRINPNNSDMLLALMDVYFRKGLIYDALKFVDDALNIDPLHMWAYSWKAYLLGVIGDFEQAIIQIKTALDINPNELILLVNLASFYSFLNDREKALETYEKVDQINPNYLKSNPYYQIKIDLLNGDKKLPPDIEHQPSAAVLPIGNLELDYLSGDMNRFEKRLIDWCAKWRKGTYTTHFSVFSNKQCSIYLHLKNHMMYHNFKKAAWYEDLLQEEREKYDRYIDVYKRPEELIT